MLTTHGINETGLARVVFTRHQEIKGFFQSLRISTAFFSISEVPIRSKTFGVVEEIYDLRINIPVFCLRCYIFNMTYTEYKTFKQPVKRSWDNNLTSDINSFWNASQISFLNAKGDGLDLHADIPGSLAAWTKQPWQGVYRWRIFYKNIINCRVIIQVFHKDSRLYDITQRWTGCLQDMFKIFQRLLSVWSFISPPKISPKLRVLWGFALIWTQGYLILDCLRIRPNRCRGIIRWNDWFFHPDLQFKNYL